MKAILSIFFIATCGLLAAQDSLVEISTNDNIAFINRQQNVIENSNSLHSFFEKLYQLKNKKINRVNIVHIGDSHIQADYLCQAARQPLQQEFGNGGLGLIVPGRLARTNEPAAIRSSSNQSWETRRLIYTDKSMPIGIGATTFRTRQPNTTLTIETPETTFDKLIIFFQKDSSSFYLNIKDSSDRDVAFAGAFTEEDENISRVLLPYPTPRVTLQTIQSNSMQQHLTLYGISLERRQPGLTYHSIGNNGAKFRHYLAAPMFFEQAKILAPDLFIISLGTNEAIEHPNVDRLLTQQMQEFLNHLREKNPDAVFIFTTPGDFYKKKARRNPGVEMVRDQLQKFTKINNLAFWDFYVVAGGKHAADHWNKTNLLQADGIHYTKAGYRIIGQLLSEAILKGYHDYVQSRYP